MTQHLAMLAGRPQKLPLMRFDRGVSEIVGTNAHIIVIIYPTIHSSLDSLET
jgi:hypothetical protein